MSYSSHQGSALNSPVALVATTRLSANIPDSVLDPCPEWFGHDLDSESLSCEVRVLAASGRHDRLRRTATIHVITEGCITFLREEGWTVALYSVGLDEAIFVSVLGPGAAAPDIERSRAVIREYFSGTGIEVEFAEAPYLPCNGKPPAVVPAEVVAAVAALLDTNRAEG